ncbi:hypothetical protein Hypma_014923 [Hypsizygus marmoreus]|uniref:Uncharacterized protein n=1 Tax=Hypsizygus marmoreus TaxID=39966 RepID=A0A369K3Z0_HYPMA|nr:hypothetical protein Hypma_014923 [Hypsizygus marmoreus]
MTQGSLIRAYEGHREKIFKFVMIRYYQLAQNMKDPFHLPQWAIDPKEPLTLYSAEHSKLLDLTCTLFEKICRVFLRNVV